MENNLQLVVKNEDGKLVLADIVETMLDAAMSQCKEANETKAFLEEQIKIAMLNAGLKSAEIGKYSCKVREYKDEWFFDANAFKEKESPELVAAFTKVEEKRDTFFDIDAFKQEQPEMYAKYLKTTITKTETIDADKLWKVLNEIWCKYATKTPAKPATISIKEK